MIAFIGMGGNLGDPRVNLKEALAQLGDLFRIERKSSLYRTAALGGPTGQPDCYNAVVEVETQSTPRETLKLLHEIERRMGREKTEKWGPRTIDLDLLDQGGLVITEDDLIIPHPMLHLRAFVLVPLGEIAPEWKHPAFGFTPGEMIEKLSPEDKSVILSVEEWL